MNELKYIDKFSDDELLQVNRLIDSHKARISSLDNQFFQKFYEYVIGRFAYFNELKETPVLTEITNQSDMLNKLKIILLDGEDNSIVVKEGKKIIKLGNEYSEEEKEIAYIVFGLKELSFIECIDNYD